jgi:hypothetical protein
VPSFPGSQLVSLVFLRFVLTRVHILAYLAIKYPDLDDASRFTIWSKFLELANCRIVAKNDLTPYMTGAVITREDLHELSSKPFNGAYLTFYGWFGSNEVP